MGWLTYITIYLVCSVAMGEGLLHDNKKTGRKVKSGEYVLVIALGPILAILYIIVKLLRWKGKT